MLIPTAAFLIVAFFVYLAICTPSFADDEASVEAPAQPTEPKEPTDRERLLAQFILDADAPVTCRWGRWSVSVFQEDRVEWEDRDAAIAAWVTTHPKIAARIKARGEAEDNQRRRDDAARAAKDAADIAHEAPALVTLRAFQQMKNPLSSINV